MYKETPSQDELLRQLRYDRKSGKLFWRARGDAAFDGKLAGKEAGTRNGRYLVVKIDGEPHYSHRLIWKIVTGLDAVGCIDHIDSDTTNNRLENLRDVTLAQNSWNTGVRRTNTSGYKGVCYLRARGKWSARIRINGEQKYLGLFETPELAHAAFVQASQASRDALARVA